MPTFSIVVLLALLGAWTWVLGRPLLHALASRSQRDSIGQFHQQRSTLGQTPQFGYAPSGRPSAAKRRRLQWFLALVMAAVVSGVLALTAGGLFVWQHLLIDVLLVGFVVMAARVGAIERERRAKVTNLRVVGSTAVPTQHLRAVGDR